MDDEELGAHSSAAAGLGKSHPAVKVSKTWASLLPRWTSFLRQLPSTRKSECQELTQAPELSNGKQDISHIYNSNFSSKFLKRGAGGGGGNGQVKLISIVDWRLGTQLMIQHVLGVHKALGAVPRIWH